MVKSKARRKSTWINGSRRNVKLTKTDSTTVIISLDPKNLFTADQFKMLNE
jgi:hypothetical protein